MKKRTDITLEQPQEKKESAGNITIKSNRRSDILAIAGCILIAIGLWFYVIGNSSADYEQTIRDVPVDIINNSSLSLLSGTGSTVDITVKGKRNTIAKLSGEDVQAEVDVSDIAQAGRYKMAVSAVLPSGVTLESISPENVSIYLDTTSTISVPLEIKLLDYVLLDGYELSESEAEANVTEIQVSGPESALADVASAQVAVHLGTVTSSVSCNGTVELLNKNGDVITKNSYIKMQTSTVTVSVPVYKYADIPVEVNYKNGFFDDSNVDITCEPKTIRVKGETSAIDRALCSVTIDEKQITSDTSYTFKVALSDGLVNVDSIETATLTIKHKGTTTADFNVSDITANNPKGLKYSIETESFNVTLRGSSDELAKLSADDITATVDLSSLNSSVGTVSLPVTITIPSASGSKIYEIGTYSVQVRIING